VTVGHVVVAGRQQDPQVARVVKGLASEWNDLNIPGDGMLRRSLRATRKRREQYARENQYGFHRIICIAG
jgi:hypothetical protein